LEHDTPEYSRLKNKALHDKIQLVLRLQALIRGLDQQLEGELEALVELMSFKSAEE
jgi:hypothetical protein